MANTNRSQSSFSNSVKQFHQPKKDQTKIKYKNACRQEDHNNSITEANTDGIPAIEINTIFIAKKIKSKILA